MARIPRKLRKIFAGSASNNGQFGSGQLGTKVITSDPDVIQALSAYDDGWNEATIGARMFPPLEEFQSLGYLDSRDIAYFYQEGIPEYNAATTYFQNSIVKKTGTYELYGSITDNNTGNALGNAVDNANWKFLLDLSLAAKIPYGVAVAAGANYTVTTNPAPSVFSTGQIILVKFPSTNAGAFQINVNATSLQDAYCNGAAAQGNEIAPAAIYPLVWDGTRWNVSGVSPIYATNAQTIAGILADRSVTPASLAALTSTTTRRGLIELATSPETIAGLASDLACSPAAIKTLFDSSSSASFTPGYASFPGLTIQWQYVTTTAGLYTWIFPKPFTQAVYAVYASNDDPHIGTGASPTDLTQAQIVSQYTGGPDGIWVLALGV